MSLRANSLWDHVRDLAPPAPRGNAGEEARAPDALGREVLAALSEIDRIADAATHHVAASLSRTASAQSVEMGRPGGGTIAHLRMSGPISIQTVGVRVAASVTDMVSGAAAQGAMSPGIAAAVSP